MYNFTIMWWSAWPWHACLFRESHVVSLIIGPSFLQYADVPWRCRVRPPWVFPGAPCPAGSLSSTTRTSGCCPGRSPRTWISGFVKGIMSPDEYFFEGPKIWNSTFWFSQFSVVFLWKKSKMKFLLASMQSLTNCEIPSSKPLQRACCSFSESRLWL